ncbi:TetR/AcrR family transcriptional regulator [Bradyrhizobium neotropicale]|uniref:TetR/AcrR family transcriptional regulator n=1 Tax=Bradyrhizobium neotropicale TaxID=1497615 RepID=UPI001AD6B302|nr:TetR/AcrR family transcriptional regulator [Bradyrhizobium neotropicale]MBO4225246.1 TetR family transcriptional regulator [Bradyrhizobium neotropicale]
MSRTRKITTDDILDAAERVVIRLGAAGLSIDAVAQEAGVSKSRVVYDHRSKSALLEALIDRRVKAELERIEQAVAENAGTPHPELFGRIADAERIPDDRDKAIAVAISASMSSEEKIQQQMRDWTMKDLRAMAAGARPKAALMAYLALTGFYVTELLGFHQWGTAERSEILAGIRTIYTSYPGES